MASTSILARSMCLALAAPGVALAQPAPYGWATSVQRLGTAADTVERRFGPGTEDGFYRRYVIAGCSVRYQFASGTILSIVAEVTARCHPAPAGRPIAWGTTLGQVSAGDNRYKAMCLNGCADHPELDNDRGLTAVGMTAPIDEERAYFLSFTGNDPATAAAWRAAIDRDPEQARNPDRYIEAFRPPPDVVRLLANVRVEKVEARFQSRLPLPPLPAR